jgi:N-acetylmuramic acid 6-phosphate (MurNAc-6-P) etherase
MQMTNEKLQRRGREILARTTGTNPAAIARAIEESGRDLPTALLMLRNGMSKEDALQYLSAEDNTARALRIAWAARPAVRMKRRRARIG